MFPKPDSGLRIGFLMKDGKPIIAFGNMGGGYQPIGHLGIESGVDFQVVQAPRQMGHNVQIGNSFFGRFPDIMRDHEKGVYFGASESRVDVQAAGY